MKQSTITVNGEEEITEDESVEEEKERERVVIITGVRPTFQLYDALSKIYTVAVFNPDAANQLAAERGNTVECPIAGAKQALYDMAYNETAHMMGKVCNALPKELKLNGLESVKVGTWAAGVAMKEAINVNVFLRTMDAYADEKDVIGIVVHEDVMPTQRALAQWGKERKIPVIHVPHANTFLTSGPDIHDQSISDWILAASPYMRDWYVRRGFQKRFIKVTGFPGWDAWATPPTYMDQSAAQKTGASFSGMHEPIVERPLTKERARRMLQLEPDLPVVSLCTGWVQRTNMVDDHSMLDAAVHLTLQAAKQEGWQLIWKLHPGDAKGREKQTAMLAAAYRLPAAILRNHLPVVLAASDGVMSIGPSNVLVESALMGTAPVIFPLRGYGFPSEPPWVVEPNVDSIASIINGLLDGEKWALAKDKFVRRYAYQNDGKAVKRTVRQIKRIIGE